MIFKKSYAMGFKIGHFNRSTTIHEYDIPEPSSRPRSKFSMKSPNTGSMTCKHNLCCTEGQKCGQLSQTKGLSERGFLWRRVRPQRITQSLQYLSRKSQAETDRGASLLTGERVSEVRSACIHRASPRSFNSGHAQESKYVGVWTRTAKLRWYLTTKCSIKKKRKSDKSAERSLRSGGRIPPREHISQGQKVTHVFVF